MKSSLLILGLIIYSLALFWVTNWAVLGGLLAIDILVLALWRPGYWRAQLRFWCKNCGFVIFLILCNWLFMDLGQALLIGARLGLAIEATYLVSQLLTTSAFVTGIATLCTPLKVFRVDTSQLALSITVALTFLPLLAREAKQLQLNLKLKGCQLSWRTLLHYPQVYLVGIMETVFVCAENAEQALRLKGYD